jgi:hypothetical protein
MGKVDFYLDRRFTMPLVWLVLYPVPQMSDTQKCDWLIGYSIAQNEFKNNAFSAMPKRKSCLLRLQKGKCT